MLVNRLGMDGYGLIAMSLSLALYLGTIIQYGFNLSGTREIAQVEKDKNKLNLVFSQYIQASHILGGIVVFFSFLILFVVDVEDIIKKLYFFAILYVLFYSLVPIWLFQGLEKFKVIAIFTSLCKMIYVLNVYLLVNDKNDIEYVNFLNFISVFILYIISMIYAFKFLNLSLKFISIKEVVLLLKRDFYVFLNQIIPNFYNNFSVFYLGIISNSLYAGLVSSAMVLVEGVLSIVKILINVIYPFLLKKVDLFNKAAKVFLILVFIGYFIYNLILPYVISLVFNDHQEDILLYARILGVSIIFGSIYLFYGLTYNLIKKTEKRVTVTIFKISLFSSFLMMIFAPIYHVFAVIFVIVFTRLLFSLYSLKFFFADKRLLNDR